MSAFRGDGSLAYKADDLTIQVGAADITDVDIILILLNQPLPASDVIQNSTSQQISSILSNNLRVQLPPSAVTTTNQVTLNVSPTVEYQEDAKSQVIGFAYDIVIKDPNGTEITTLSKPLDITFPYDDAALSALKLTPEQLVPAHFNPTTNSWVKITNFTLDKVNKLIVAKVDHLTRFALIGAADITPPAAPTSIRVTKVPNGNLITWVNPTADFRHAKVYRSTEEGKLGSVIYAQVPHNSVIDTAITDGAKYYYVVRSVDPAGNESINTEQAYEGKIVSVSIKISSKFAKEVPGTIGRDLAVGASGEDVMLLQRILWKEGVYPEALMTGYFGSLTDAAVKRFQIKYKESVLTPVKLQSASGYVGAYTRKKLLELKVKYSL